MKMRVILIIFGGLLPFFALADSYKWICPKCGKTWWTASVMDNLCPKCSWYGNQTEHKFESSASSSAFSGDTSIEAQIRWNGRHAANEIADRHRKNMRDFTQGLIDNQIAQNNLQAQYCAENDFDFVAALKANFSSFPQGVRERIKDLKNRGFLSPKCMRQLGNRQKDTYDYMVYMIKVLQSEGRERALDEFWRKYAQSVSVVRPSLQGGMEDSFKNNMYMYVATLAVRPFDRDFERHNKEILDIFAQAIRSVGLNPTPYAPPAAMPVQQQRQPFMQNERGSALQYGSDWGDEGFDDSSWGDDAGWGNDAFPVANPAGNFNPGFYGNDTWDGDDGWGNDDGWDDDIW